MKIAHEMAALVGGGALVVALTGGLGLWAAWHNETTLRSVYLDRTVPAAQLGDAVELLTTNRLLLADALADVEPATTGPVVEAVMANRDRLGATWKAYAASEMTADERALASEFEKSLSAWRAQGTDPLIAALKAGDRTRALQIATEDLPPLFKTARDTLARLKQLQVDVARQQYDAAMRTSSGATIALLVVALAGLGAAAAVGTLITRRLTRALGAEPLAVRAVADGVAGGDLSMPIALRAGDDSSVMAAMVRMRDSLSSTVGQVRRNADSVASASAQIASGNHDLSSRTENQASALQQTAASMEELGSTVRQNADNAREADRLAKDASAVAHSGGTVVTQVVETMRGIDDASRRIAEIIGTIDAIAFQTNILALNAAVEAARAGEQGRGFAVVAGEVRTLAQRSADAARQIKTLIQASVERVEQGTEQADRAGTAMQEIVIAIQRVTDIMGEIASASAEQSAGVAQVGEAVTQMDLSTQQNAALVEESAAAAESLRQQSQALVAAVSAFRVAA